MKLKIIKRDWKLPNLSHFTYTSIVQCILQVLYSFKPGLPQKVAISKRSKMLNSKQTKHDKNGPFLVLFQVEPPYRFPMAKSIPFYKQKYCTTILPDFYDAPSKRSKIAKFVLFYMQKYCTTILHSFKPGSPQKVAISKRSKMAISNQSKWQF